MRRIVTVLGIVSVVACAAPLGARAQGGASSPLAQLQTNLANAAYGAPGKVAVEVKDLPTGYVSSVNANAVMPAASTIKIPIMVEVFRQLEAGNFDLNRPVQLLPGDRDWGSGTIASSPVGAAFPVSELLTQMITVSDNTAANMLIRLVGRQSINATMTDLGLRHTKIADYIRTADWSVRRTLRTTPADMVALLTQMAKNDLIDQWSSRQMVAILEAQEINTLLPEPLPAIPIAHKTGSLDDTLNDVGIVYAANEPYVIAVMTTDLPTLAAGRRFIRKVSRVTYASLEEFAKWRVESAPDPSPSSGRGDVPMWSEPTPAPEATP